MKWERIEGEWMQFKGHVKKQWGKLTDDQLDVINGRREVLAGKIRESYGIGKDEAEKQIDEWEASLERDPSLADDRTRADADDTVPRERR